MGQNLGCHGTERSEEGAKIQEFVRLSFGKREKPNAEIWAELGEVGSVRNVQLSVILGE